MILEPFDYLLTLRQLGHDFFDVEVLLAASRVLAHDFVNHCAAVLKFIELLEHLQEHYHAVGLLLQNPLKVVETLQKPLEIQACIRKLRRLLVATNVEAQKLNHLFSCEAFLVHQINRQSPIDILLSAKAKQVQACLVRGTRGLYHLRSFWLWSLF